MRSVAAATMFALTFASANAFGADAGAGDDVDSLSKQLQQEYATLSTHDCAIACKAYASIRRAADRICGLEPGPRCNDARSKADDAQRRVQAACPDCQIAAAPAPGKEDERRAVQAAPPTESKTGGSADSESAPRKGGCASCSTPGEKPIGDLGIAFIAAVVVARIAGRRKRA
jgi:hypothetical protein